MNGVLLQEKIYRGYKKTATKIGNEYELYRFTSAIDPIQDHNRLGSIMATFATRTRPYEVPQQFKEQVWLMYADGSVLQPLDILVGPYGTWYVGDMQPLMPIQALRCNDSARIIRVLGTSVVGGMVVTDEQVIAVNLPIFKQTKRIDIKNPQFATQTAGQAITHWTTFIPLPEGSIQQHDIVTDKLGIQYEIDAPDFTNMGYVVSMRLLQP